MMRALIFLVVLASVPFSIEAQAGDPHLQLAKRVLSSVPLFDGHNDLPWAIRNADIPMDVRAYDISRPAVGHTDLKRLREGGGGAARLEDEVGPLQPVAHHHASCSHHGSVFHFLNECTML